MPKMSRRTFLWLTGGSGVAIATDTPQKLVNKLIPQIVPPEQIEPGEWTFFATTCRECPAGCGMHLWHRDGRVTKAEGNPEHPVNRGGLCPRGQSALQGLYDPDRVRTVSRAAKGGARRRTSWDEALGAITGRLAAGGRAAILSNLQTGSLAEVMRSFAAAFGEDRLLFFEPFHYEPLKAAHQEVFGVPVIPSYQLEGCELVLSFGADFLESWISPVSFAAQFGNLRGYREGESRLNRMVYVGPRLSMTAANADLFLQVPPGYEAAVAAALLKIVLERGWGRHDLPGQRPALDALLAKAGPVPGVTEDQLVELARAFAGARSSVALAGAVGSAGTAATATATLAALLNHCAGRVGQTVDFSAPHALTQAAREGELQQFLASLTERDVLFVHECNPLYSRPWCAPLLQRCEVVYLGTMMDETARTAQWFLPLDYPLEAWGDYQPAAGINGIMQPTMGRLYDTRSGGDIFLDLARRAGKPLQRAGSPSAPADFGSWVRARWEPLGPSPGSGSGEAFWTAALQRGGAWKAPAGATPATLRADAGTSLAALAFPRPRQRDEAELVLWSSIMLFDGRVANRGWLQEAPDPVTSVVWGNWIDLHPRTAAALGIGQGEVAELLTVAGSVRAPARITDEVGEGVAAISFGQGHDALGKNAKGIGVNAFVLLNRDGSFGPCHIRRAGGVRDDEPVYTVDTRRQHERQILQTIPLSRVSRTKAGEGEPLVLPLPEGYRPGKDLYPAREYRKHRWAMVVDLQRCIGCGACAVACYAENNVAVVGKERVAGGREMAWLRVVPQRLTRRGRRFAWLPLLCQHCDAAPCEPVCPTYAAVHNEEGLNAQIYNRCVGTRYCSNNCPYKVRRFNWIDPTWRAPLDLQLNPEVTVRTRGVMEKCTFCVQRIRQAEYRAARERRPVRDLEIQPACMQSCPTRVYSFGDLLDPDSQVSRLTRGDPRRYHVLEELNTKPGIVYLKMVDPEA